jgi:rhodanese-related sulfurtransferase
VAAGHPIPDPVPEIGRDELRARLHDPTLTIVDVLADITYASAHIEGAINLPLADLERRAATLLPDRGAEIAVYCASDT